MGRVSQEEGNTGSCCILPVPSYSWKKSRSFLQSLSSLVHHLPSVCHSSRLSVLKFTIFLQSVTPLHYQFFSPTSLFCCHSFSHSLDNEFVSPPFPICHSFRSLLHLFPPVCHIFRLSSKSCISIPSVPHSFSPCFL